MNAVRNRLQEIVCFLNHVEAQHHEWHKISGIDLGPLPVVCPIRQNTLEDRQADLQRCAVLLRKTHFHCHGGEMEEFVAHVRFEEVALDFAKLVEVFIENWWFLHMEFVLEAFFTG